jgi:hypothetical protein
MAAKKRSVCPACGFRNREPLPKARCASCGADVEQLRQQLAQAAARRFRSQSFSPKWFAISLTVSLLLTTAIVLGLPKVAPVFDFEGSAGILVAIPTWFVAGMLVGLVAPGRTFVEPLLATALVVAPTALWLFRTQTVKTLPGFLYVLLAALGLIFTLMGVRAGERLQFGAESRDSR